MATATLWTVCLTAGLGLVSWILRTAWHEINRQNILLNRTREELAKEYTTKAESRADMSRVIDRLEALDAKLDRLIERK